MGSSKLLNWNSMINALVVLPLQAKVNKVVSKSMFIRKNKTMFWGLLVRPKRKIKNSPSSTAVLILGSTLSLLILKQSTIEFLIWVKDVQLCVSRSKLSRLDSEIIIPNMFPLNQCLKARKYKCLPS